MSIEKALTDLTAALNANTAALQAYSTAAATVPSAATPTEQVKEPASASGRRTRKPKATETVDKAAIYFYNESLDRVVIMFPDKHAEAVKRLDEAENVKRISMAEYSELKDAGVDKFPYQEDMTEAADWMTEDSESSEEEEDGLSDGMDGEPEFEPTAEDVKDALIKVRDQIGKPKLAEIFKAIGVKTFPEITEDKFANAYRLANEALAG